MEVASSEISPLLAAVLFGSTLDLIPANGVELGSVFAIARISGGVSILFLAVVRSSSTVLQSVLI